MVAVFYPRLAAALLLMLSLASALEASGSVTEQHPALVLDQERLIVIGTDSNQLTRTCFGIKEYSVYLLTRNHLQARARQASEFDCLSPLPFPLQRQKSLVWLAYGYDTPSKYFNKAGKYVYFDVSDVLPRELWDRYRTSHLYDSICYNTALVASGLLRFQDLTAFSTSIEWFLGMKRDYVHVREGRIEVENNEPANISLVQARAKWAFARDNERNTKAGIDAFIKQNFSPGSVLCFDFTGLKEVETRGEHCLALITPDLVIEANGGLPHNLVQWDQAWDFAFSSYRQETNDRQFGVRYFQLSNDKVIQWSSSAALFSSDSTFTAMSALLSQFHQYYESLGSSLDDYSPENQFLLMNFTKNVLAPGLMAGSFSEYSAVPELIMRTDPTLIPRIFTNEVALADPALEQWLKIYFLVNQ